MWGWCVAVLLAAPAVLAVDTGGINTGAGSSYGQLRQQILKIFILISEDTILKCLLLHLYFPENGFLMN